MEKVYLTYGEDGFDFRLRGASIKFDDLRVGGNANWKFPHCVYGKGGALIALTDQNLLELMSEYLRYTLCRNEETEVSLTRKSVGYHFSCGIEKVIQ